jgi:hypothetical protein
VHGSGGGGPSDRAFFCANRGGARSVTRSFTIATVPRPAVHRSFVRKVEKTFVAP